MLERVIDVSKRAGEEIMRFYADVITPEIKKDGSVVTPADRAAEKIIRDGLHAIAPNIPFIGEESVEAGIVPDVTGGTFWCVDPLDGTRNFVERTGKFAVLIGLVQNGVPVLGVLYAPALNLLAAGGMDLGVTIDRGDGGRSINRLSALRDPKRILVEQRIKDKPAVQNYVGRLNGNVAITDNAWPFLEMIVGDYDVNVAFSQSYEWDTAATHAMVGALGGHVLAPGSAPLPYGKTTQKFKNPHLLAVKSGFDVPAGDF